ncbi:hypothetical protein scyTo_0009179 [Scyliorhinus torazame]|uniref:Uncharacterized protein n=1 Tax=Scyliorhinus torazame TaxID=75743 RepID=A0A401NHV7_SCYTO|nr:hypothetical protein [Scyliorhinus torazame]
MKSGRSKSLGDQKELKPGERELEENWTLESVGTQREEEIKKAKELATLALEDSRGLGTVGRQERLVVLERARARRHGEEI